MDEVARASPAAPSAPAVALSQGDELTLKRLGLVGRQEDSALAKEYDLLIFVEQTLPSSFFP